MIVETFKIMESSESFHLPPKAYKLNLFKLNRPSSALMKSTENNQELRCWAFSPRQNLLFNAFRAVEFKSQLLLHFEKEKKKKERQSCTRISLHPSKFEIDVPRG